MAREYIEESESVALHNGFGESYDHEAATLEAIHDAGVEEGIEQGIQKGIEKNKIQNAKKLYNNGVSKEIICKSIDITNEKLGKILKEN